MNELAGELTVVTEPMRLFWQVTVTVLLIFIPLNSAPVAPPVKVIDPVPAEEPMVLPAVVPIFAAVSVCIPVHEAAPELL